MNYGFLYKCKTTRQVWPYFDLQEFGAYTKMAASRDVTKWWSVMNENKRCVFFLTNRLFRRPEVKCTDRDENSMEFPEYPFLFGAGQNVWFFSPEGCCCLRAHRRRVTERCPHCEFCPSYLSPQFLLHLLFLLASFLMVSNIQVKWEVTLQKQDFKKALEMTPINRIRYKYRQV